jgi:hypothetical protein
LSGDLQPIGVESTGSYGAGLLHKAQQAGVAVLEVTTPDKQIAAGEARTTISTLRTPRMLLSQANEPSPHRAATA